MPWLETGPMDQRMQLIADITNGVGSIAALSDQYGVSRKTAHKWLARFKAHGEAGLVDQSRRPLVQPRSTPEVVCERLVELRKRHPNWGPKKIRVLALQEDASLAVPAASTVGRILDAAGLVAERVRRRRWPTGGGMRARAEVPNGLWCADYKGQFRMGDGQYCYPLTVTDHASRMLLCCNGMHAIRTADAIRAFEALFYEFGLPERIHTDNGAPFASVLAAAGLSELAVWWIERGILLERSRPHHPQDNGRHERMHRSLAAAVTRPPQQTLADQQVAFDRFRQEFNHLRPHEALGDLPPAAVYARSPREYTGKIMDPAYPTHWETRRVRRNGWISLRGIPLPVPGALAGRDVALEPLDDGGWRLAFHRVIIGSYHRTGQRGQPWRLDCTGHASRLYPSVPAP